MPGTLNQFAPSNHTQECQYHCDQNPLECTCGIIGKTREYELGWKCFELGQSRDCLHWKSFAQVNAFQMGWDAAKANSQSPPDC